MRIKLIATLTAIAAGSIATSAIVVAAEPAPQARAAWMQDRAAAFAKMRQRRADDLALLIGLRPEQRPALDAMLAAMEPPHRDWGRERTDGEKPAADDGMIARLDRMSARIDARSTAAKAKLDTLRRFYAGLSPDQKLRFDALERLRHDHDRMGRHGGMRGGMHGGPGGGPEGGPGRG